MTIYCFLELSSGFVPIPGKVIIELFDNQVPLVAENFRALCTGEKGGDLHYHGTQFHRVVETYILQGGDTTGTGSGGSNIFGNEKDAFVGEDLTWRDVDAEMLLCMAEPQPRSQFFITLRPSPHLNGTHCCFGRVIRGQDILLQLSEVEVDDDDKPLEPITISRCGELEYKGPPVTTTTAPAQTLAMSASTELPPHNDHPRARDRSPSRSRRNSRTRTDRRSASSSRSGSRSPRRTDRHSRSRERSHHHKQRTSERRPRDDSHRRRDRDEDERISRQERLREYQRYKRDPKDKPDVIYKGRGKMVYQAKESRSSYGRLT